jgi:hypothetical protein
MTNLALIKIASEKVRENLKLAADKGHDARAIKDIGIGYWSAPQNGLNRQSVPN